MFEHCVNTLCMNQLKGHQKLRSHAKNPLKTLLWHFAMKGSTVLFHTLIMMDFIRNKVSKKISKSVRIYYTISLK